MERDKALTEAIKTIRKAQGWRVCPVRYAYWHRPGVGCDEVPDDEGAAVCWAPFLFHLPDPLADTPEGDHAFMEILRWADPCFLLSIGNGYGWWVDVLSDGPDAPSTRGTGDTLNQAVIRSIGNRLALAAALEEQG